MSTVAIVGSAFADYAHDDLEEVRLGTEFGDALLHRVTSISDEAYLLFRHGSPHEMLPNQINYRANTAAIRDVGCHALLVTSSVGVMRPELPLFKPMLVADLIMLENRLPDGSACTMFVEPFSHQGHLVLDDGLFSSELSDHVAHYEEVTDQAPTFFYVQGPRTKTRAENALLPLWGGDVNSMTLAPEVVLANEYEIPTVAIVVGHKYSLDVAEQSLDVAGSLVESKRATESVVLRFLEQAPPVPFGNALFRF